LATIRLPNSWRPRDYQRDLWSYLESGGKRADVAAHRRWGKDDVALNWAAVAAFERVGTYWHMLPEASQARKAIWDAINPHTGKRRIDEAFPKELRETTREVDMLIRFKNGSTWQVVGSDNYNSLVGSPPVGVVFSEWSLAKPDAWTYMRPILAENGGWAVFIWTPRGRNHAVQAFEARRQDAAWFTQRSPATDTGVFSEEQLAKEKRELIDECGSTEEGTAKFSQEYLVDFDAATPGAYYASLINDAERENPSRVSRVPYDPSLQVYTAWDLGIDDYTAIWFFQQVGREVRAIDYYETSGVGLQTIVREAISEKPYVYAAHHLPHDVEVRELGAGGKSRRETLAGLGLQHIVVGAAQDPEERINASRQMIPITWFDAEKCALGLNRLRQYRKRWNRSTSSFVGPLHDENSHGSDAFGEFAMNRRGVQAAKPKPKVVHHGAGGWMS
jgi:phage terminase large subunit